MIVGAPPKSFKSLLTMNLCYALASGKDPLSGSEITPKRILYLEQEIGLYSLRARMTQIVGAGAGGARAEAAADNLYFHSGRGLMLSGSEIRSVVSEVAPDIIVIDPLRKFHAFDENKSEDAMRVNQLIQSIQGDSGVIVVHHAGKKKEGRNVLDFDSLRGSSEFFADCDSAFMLNRTRNSLVVQPVLRHAAEPEQPWRFRVNPQTLQIGFPELVPQESD